MDWNVPEWFNLVLRWFHVMAGISWVGASFYFLWLDRAFARPQRIDAAERGELYMVHSVSAQLVERFKPDPSELFKTRWWYKRETALTWVSGVLLLAMVCYLPGSALLSDAAAARIGLPVTLAITAMLFAASWWIYDRLWASALGTRPLWAGLLSLALLMCAAWAFAWLYTGRGAFIHVGSLLGTLMAANVWFRLVPAMQAMGEAHQSGHKPDEVHIAHARQRSVHNSYLTFSMVALMVSNHVPIVYSHPLSWIALVLVSAGFVGARHHVVGGKHGKLALLGGIVALALAIALVATVPDDRSSASTDGVTFAAVRDVIQKRCLACHSAFPANRAYGPTPGGVGFDTPQGIRGHAQRIKLSTVTNRSMPMPHDWGMTPAEREMLGRWIDHGARLE